MKSRTLTWRRTVKPPNPARFLARAQTALDRLAGLGRSGLGSRRHVPGKDALNQDEATLSSIGKDKDANDAATLLLLAAQDVLQRIDSLRTTVPTGNTESVPAKTPTGPAVDDQLQRNLLAALAELAAEATQTGDAASASVPAAGESSTPVTDFLITESAQADQDARTRGALIASGISGSRCRACRRHPVGDRPGHIFRPGQRLRSIVRRVLRSAEFEERRARHSRDGSCCQS